MVHVTVFIHHHHHHYACPSLCMNDDRRRASRMEAEREREREMMCQSLNLKPPTAGWQPEGNRAPLLLHIQLSERHLAFFHPLWSTVHLKGQLWLLKWMLQSRLVCGSDFFLILDWRLSSFITLVEIGCMFSTIQTISSQSGSSSRVIR